MVLGHGVNKNISRHQPDHSDDNPGCKYLDSHLPWSATAQIPIHKYIIHPCKRIVAIDRLPGLRVVGPSSESNCEVRVSRVKVVSVLERRRPWTGYLDQESLVMRQIGVVERRCRHARSASPL